MVARSTFNAAGKKNAGVIEAVTKLGGARQAARELEVSCTAVLKWIYQNCPAERAVQLEDLTGVGREKMRPDLFER